MPRVNNRAKRWLQSSAHDDRLLYANFADFVVFEVLGEGYSYARERLADGQHVGSDGDATESSNHGDAKHYAGIWM